jgi:hypothetical protein
MWWVLREKISAWALEQHSSPPGLGLIGRAVLVRVAERQ